VHCNQRNFAFELFQNLQVDCAKAEWRKGLWKRNEWFCARCSAAKPRREELHASDRHWGASNLETGDKVFMQCLSYDCITALDLLRSWSMVRQVNKWHRNSSMYIKFVCMNWNSDFFKLLRLSLPPVYAIWQQNWFTYYYSCILSISMNVFWPKMRVW